MEDASGSGPAESGLEQPGPAQPPAPPADGAAAVATLGRADGLMDESEPEQALALYRSVTGTPDRDIAAAGYFGAGNALYRLDREPADFHLRVQKRRGPGVLALGDANNVEIIELLPAN